MRISFAGRNVVSIGAMPLEALRTEGFERLAGGRAKQQISTPQLVLAEFDRFRLLATPDNRVQVEFPPDARRDLIRRTVQELVDQLSPYPIRALGFNGLVRIDLSEGDQDPVAPLLDLASVEERLGVEPARVGVKLTYPLDESRTSLDLMPAEDEEQAWGGAVNRHYASMPDADELSRAVEWFADLRESLPQLVGRVLAADGVEGETHAA